MFAIAIGDEFIDLNPGTALDLVLVNPMFQDDLGLGMNSHSFSMAVPWSPKNQRLLAQRETALVPRRDPKVNAVLWLLGSPWKLATISFSTSSRSEGYSIRMDLDASVLARAIEDRSMRDFSYTGPRVISVNTGQQRSADVQQHMNDCMLGTNDYVFFPVLTKEIVHDPIPFNALLNGWENAFGATYFYTNYDQFTFEAGPFSGAWIAPFPFVAKTMQMILDEADIEWDMGATIFTDTELKWLCIFSPVSLDEVIQETNSTLVETFNVNCYAGTIELAKHMPSIPAKTFFSSVLTLFGMFVEIDARGRVTIPVRKEVLEDQTTDDWTKKTVAGTVIDHTDDATGFTLGSVLDQNDPQTSEPFWTEQSSFSISGTVPFGAPFPVLGAAGVGQYYYAEDTNAVFQYRLNEMSNPASYAWVRISNFFYDVTFGDGSRELRSEASTMNDQVFSSIPYDTIPKTDLSAIPISLPSYDDFELALRLLFYRGRAPLSSPAGYDGNPVGTAGDFNGAFNYSLHWTGDRGLYEVWWKDWIAFLLDAKLVRASFVLNASDLMTLDWKKRKAFATREGIARGYIRKLSVRLFSDRIEPVQAEIITG